MKFFHPHKGTPLQNPLGHVQHLYSFLLQQVILSNGRLSKASEADGTVDFLIFHLILSFLAHGGVETQTIGVNLPLQRALETHN